MSSIEYFKEYIIYSIIALITATITYFTCSLIPIESIALVVRVIVAGIIPNIIYIIIFHKTEEFKYLLGVADTMVISKIKKKIRSKSDIEVIK